MTTSFNNSNGPASVSIAAPAAATASAAALAAASTAASAAALAAASTAASAAASAAAPGPAPIFPPAVAGLIFDCDGVLFDSKDANTAFYDHVLSLLNLPPLTPELAAWAHMSTVREVFERTVPASRHERLKELGKTIRYNDLFMPLLEPMPGMPEFLKAARDKGLRLALCTNRDDSVLELLKYFKIDLFNPVINVSNAPAKPAPDGLLRIIEEWKLPTEQLLYVGDSPVDQEAAKNARIPLVAYNNPSLNAAVHIQNFQQLNPLLD